MKKIILPAVIGCFVLAISMTSCGGGKGDWTPESAAAHWCELDHKIKAADGEEKEKLKKEQNDFENEMEKLFQNKEDMNKIEELAEKCEA